MKIVLFQFYSPNPCPDYDEMGNYLTHQGHEVFVSHMTMDGKLRLYSQNVSQEFDIFPWKIKNSIYFTFFARRLAFILFMSRLRRLIKQIKPDIFIVATSELMYLSLLPILMPRQTVFIYDVRQLGFTPGNSILVKLINKKTKLNMWFLSQFIYDHSCFAFEDAAKIVLGDNWKNKKASVMEVGVNQGFFNTPRTIKKTDQDILQLVYIGSLAKIRKLEFIIDSARQLVLKTQGFHITFIGPDPGNYYHNLLKKSNLKNYISILDPVPYQEIPVVLNNYHVAIAYVPDHPDWHYQPTLKVKEYCAVGMPVIASDNKPNRVFVKENGNGIFFKNTKEDFCKTILALINNVGLLDKITQNSQKNREGITWEDSARNYEKLFENLI